MSVTPSAFGVKNQECFRSGNKQGSCEFGVAHRSSIGLLRPNSSAINRRHHGVRWRVLISALSFDLMDEAYKRAGFDSTAIGFVGGAACVRPPRLVFSSAGCQA